VNTDGIKDEDMLVLNITFKPTPIGGFDSVDRTLRVEFIHDQNKEGVTDGSDLQTWLFANQSVFTATGVASDEVVGLGTDGEGDANTSA
jgi:hypothetical protein